jgi:hypothetical protein
MTTLKLKGYVDENGRLELDLPKSFAKYPVEISIQVLQDDVPRDANGWPIGFFDRTFGALADDPLEEIAPYDTNGWPIGFFEQLDAIQSDDLIEHPKQLPLQERDEHD